MLCPTPRSPPRPALPCPALTHPARPCPALPCSAQTPAQNSTNVDEIVTMTFGTPTTDTLVATQFEVTAIKEVVEKIHADIVERKKAKKDKEKRKEVEAEAKAAQDKKDKENRDANIKKLTEALNRIPRGLHVSADHLVQAGQELHSVAVLVETVIGVAYPVPPSSSAGASSSAAGASSSAAGAPPTAGQPPPAGSA